MDYLELVLAINIKESLGHYFKEKAKATKEFAKLQSKYFSLELNLSFLKEINKFLKYNQKAKDISSNFCA